MRSPAAESHSVAASPVYVAATSSCAARTATSAPAADSRADPVACLVGYCRRPCVDVACRQEAPHRLDAWYLLLPTVVRRQPRTTRVGRHRVSWDRRRVVSTELLPVDSAALMALRPCIVCREPSPQARCPNHRLPDQRPNRHARGYDTAYDQRRRQLRARAAANHEPCWLCGQPIDYQTPTGPQAFSAHHTGRSKATPLVATHLVCNISAGQPHH